MEEIKLRKFRALVSEKGLDDGGCFLFTFEVDQLIKGKVYIQADERYYCKVDYIRKPFFVDDNGCSREIEYMLKEGKIEEIFDDEKI